MKRLDGAMYRAGLVGILLLGSISAPAQVAATLGDIRYAVPAGWSTTPDTGGGIKLSPSTLEAGAVCVVVLRPSEALTGDFAGWFSRIWLPLLSAGQMVQSTPPQHQAMMGSPNDAMFAAAILRDESQTPHFIEAFGIRAGGRVIAVIWTVNRRELLTQYLQPVRQLLYSVMVSPVAANPGTATDSVTAPSSGTASDSGHTTDTATIRQPDMVVVGPASTTTQRLDGPYLGLYMGYGLGQSMYATHISHRILVFFPDGTVIYAPEKGLDGFDVQSALRDGSLQRQWYGRYSLQEGGGILVIFPNSNLKLLLDEKGINPGMGRYIPLCKCTDLALDGKFKVSGTESFITFTRDGRFADETGAIRELLQYSFSDEERKTGIIGYGQKITEPGAGTYHIVNNTIVFAYADGRRLTSSFYAPARALSARPPWFLIHDMNLELVP